MSIAAIGHFLPAPVDRPDTAVSASSTLSSCCMLRPELLRRPSPCRLKLPEPVSMLFPQAASICVLDRPPLLLFCTPPASQEANSLSASKAAQLVRRKAAESSQKNCAAFAVACNAAAFHDGTAVQEASGRTCEICSRKHALASRTAEAGFADGEASLNALLFYRFALLFFVKPSAALVDNMTQAW